MNWSLVFVLIFPTSLVIVNAIFEKFLFRIEKSNLLAAIYGCSLLLLEIVG